MSLATERNSLQEPLFKQYNYRIVITILYSVASIINGMCWVVVTPISVQIQNAFEVSALWVAFIPMSYMLFYIFINFPSNWVIDVKGIKKGVVIGASVTMLGCLIRSLVKVSFAFVVIGQVFCAIAQPFLLNAPMKIASRWFLPQNRSLAMAVLTVVNIIGTAVGFLIPPLFVTQQSDNKTVKQQFFVLLVVEAIISVFSAILIIIFFKQSPPTLPSKSAMVQSVEYRKSIGLMIKNKKFMLLSISFGTVNGTFNIYGSLMDDILDPYGFTSDNVSTFGTCLMVSGIISAGIFSAYVEKTLKYKNVFILCCLIGFLTIVAFPLSLKFLTDSSKYYWIYLILVTCQGLVFIPLQPLTIDYGSDTMFPIGEAQITGFMISMGQIFGVLFVQIAQLLFGLGDSTKTNQQLKTAAFNSVVFCNAFLIVGCIILLLQNGELKRAKIDLNLPVQKQQSLLGTQKDSVFLSRTGNSESLLT